MNNNESKNNLSLEQWECYLEELEVKQVEETLNDPLKVSTLGADDYKLMFTDFIGQNHDPHKESIFKVVLSCLTEKQQTVIRLLFWQNMTLAEASRYLQVSHSTVSQHRSAALKKIKILLNKSREILLLAANGQQSEEAA